jgi:hypothetical protein
MFGPKSYRKWLIFLVFYSFFCLLNSPSFAATNSAPVTGTITTIPTTRISNVNQSVTFTTTYTDSNGYQDIKEAYFLVNTGINGKNCFYGYYNQQEKKFYLRNNQNTAWFSAAQDINSYARLDSAIASGNGNILTITWKVTFKPTFLGRKNMYLYVKDNANAVSGWSPSKGSWTIINHAPTVPAIGAIDPASGSSYPNQEKIFTTTVSDQDGWENIQYVYFAINSPGINNLYARYNQDLNELYLINDAGAWPKEGYTPAEKNNTNDRIVENSYVRLNCTKTTVSNDGNNNLSVKWAVTFKSKGIGNKKASLYVIDDSNAYTGWIQRGSFTIVVDTTPPTGTIKINNDNQYTNSNQVTLNLQASDNVGGTGLSQMQFSNNNITWSNPETYATTKNPWTLTSGDGPKTVYVKYKDNAGNWSQSYSNTITLDTSAPAISINPVTTPTNQNVTLSYTVSDNFTPQNEIIVTGDNSPYASEGTHNVTLAVKDKAGNISSKSLSFTIDKTPPVIIITSPQDGSVVEESEIALTGTIDGSRFSENVTLTSEGQNIITKTATDAAGNTASRSIKVTLDRGQAIGPEGGEVVSSDGKVRLSIPKNALTQPTYIKLRSMDTQIFEGITPQARSLLSVVECKPYGLIFQKPATITYTLPQAEIPGTAVELGYYDYLQDKILATGQISTVATDSYSINFSIVHFSTYAALKSFTSTGAPIGGGVRIPLPDMFTGSFSHAIPLTVSPGRKGMQPSLGLSYRSSNPNSWLGLGFSLNPGYIVRSTRLGPPSYDDTKDSFYFVTDSGTTELVHLTDNLYQAKIESSFAKFFKENDGSWRVVGKDGSSLRFGQTTDAKETSNSGTFSWYLTKAIDTNKNYIEYTYIKDQGKSYLSRIDYTGNETGLSPTNSVEFFLESRDDIPSSYLSTSKISTAKRLKEIQVKVHSELVWRYVLEYTYSPDTNRSLLKTITQYGADGKELPQQRLKYQAAK